MTEEAYLYIPDRPDQIYKWKFVHSDEQTFSREKHDSTKSSKEDFEIVETEISATTTSTNKKKRKFQRLKLQEILPNLEFTPITQELPDYFPRSSARFVPDEKEIKCYRQIEDILDRFESLIGDYDAEMPIAKKNRAPKIQRLMRCKRNLDRANRDSVILRVKKPKKKLRVSSWKMTQSLILGECLRQNHRRPRFQPIRRQVSHEGYAGTSNPNIKNILQNPVYKQTRKFAVVEARNEMDRLLVELQTRDITPEDYDLLLRLDEKLKKRTVHAADVEKLPDVQLNPESPVFGDPCAICLDLLWFEQRAKQVPCGHIFHTSCIKKWLLNNSYKCPVDQIPIDDKYS